MRIEPVTDTDSQEYAKLAAAHGTLFNSPKWLSLYGPRLKVMGIVGDDDRLVGAFCTYAIRNKLLRVVRNPPFMPHCGLFFVSKASNPAMILSADKEHLDSVAAFLRGMKGCVVRLGFPPHHRNMLPFIWRKFKVIPHYTYLADLSLSDDELLQRLSPKLRNNARSARRAGVHCEPAADLEVIGRLVSQTFAENNIVYDKELLHKILFDFADEANSFGVVAYYQDKPSALAFCVCDGISAYYLLGGTDGSNRHDGSGVLAILSAMKNARERGSRVFDFEGSMIPRIEHFFRGFGGRLTPYFTVNRAPLLIEMGLKLCKRELF